MTDGLEKMTEFKKVLSGWLSENCASQEEPNQWSGWDTDLGDLLDDMSLKPFFKFLSDYSQASREEADKKYEDIFKWLFGEIGNFPDCDVSKKKYAWRSVLRKKLDSLRSNPVT